GCPRDRLLNQDWPTSYFGLPERMERARANLKLAERNLQLAKEAQTKPNPSEKLPKKEKIRDLEQLKETLLALDKQIWEASTKGDTKALRKLMAENYLSIWALDDRTDKAQSLETAKRYRYSDRTMRDIEIRRVSQNAAVLTYVCSYKVSVDNEEPRELSD